jgi:hypothetical protein
LTLRKQGSSFLLSGSRKAGSAGGSPALSAKRETVTRTFGARGRRAACAPSQVASCKAGNAGGSPALSAKRENSDSHPWCSWQASRLRSHDCRTRFRATPSVNFRLRRDDRHSASRSSRLWRQRPACKPRQGPVAERSSASRSHPG